MALSSALYSGISGLSTLGNAMQIIGDNIANVNTIGFKGSTFTFQDLLSQSVSTMSGTAQVGRGAGLGDIYSGFDQGSFESTGSSTDLGIGGEGFFIVQDTANTTDYLTRAGNFRFDKDGNFINPEGYVVQGWALDSTGNNTGSVGDVTLTSFSSSPSETTDMEVIVNLDSAATDKTTGSDTALSSAWNGSQATPLAATAYEYSTTLKAYDSLGNTHDTTVYFDKGNTANTWEYIVTCNPSEDLRVGGTATVHTGLLARGTMLFNTAGGFDTSGTPLTMQRSDGAGNWTASMGTASTTNGHFTFAPALISGSPMTIELDFGLRWSGSAWLPASLTSSQFARGSTTNFQSADGYGAGALQSVSVDVAGAISGNYSNGEVIPLFRVALAKVNSLSGLKKEGGNLFSETRDSGSANPSSPGTNGTGTIAPNALEQSNVDIAAEFVKMITTQRGFQANSKIITVTDQMLAELINLKR
ncbi:flagellar hook protein FlgE [Thermodesulfobacteriota bacterium]